jgi:hypothetical protein
MPTIKNLSQAEIENRFGYHPGTPETIKQHERVRAGFIAFATYLNEILADGRAKSTAMTNLQQAAMWANFAVAEKAPLVMPSAEINPDQLELELESTPE